MEWEIQFFVGDLGKLVKRLSVAECDGSGGPLHSEMGAPAVVSWESAALQLDLLILANTK